MPLVLQGATSGQATLTPTDGATVSLTLPSTSGTLVSSGSVPAGGSNNQVQYNSSGTLAGSSNLQFNGSLLSLGTSSTGTVNQLQFSDGGARAAGNNWGMFWSDSAGETNAALWASYTGGNNAAALVFGTNNGTGGASGIASTTERMRLDSSGNLLFNSGYGSVATAYGCRAWVNFNGTNGSIRASGGVSSITRHSTGQYTVNLTITMPDVNYCATASVSTTSAPVGCFIEMFTATNNSQVATAPTTSSFSMGVLQYNAAAFSDPVYVNVSVFR